MTEMSHRLLFDMMRIRAVEETIAARYGEQKMRCPTHLSVGQEAVAAAAGAVLKPTDLAVSGHRAHAHYLAKGGSLKAMIAEIYGRVTGCSRGKGGSMHLIDESAGFMGSTAIVGGTVPVGVGLAYPMKIKQTGQIACVFLGDAVPETGVFFESVNFAVLKQLPVLFLCENNGYSVYSPLGVRQPPGRKLFELLAGFGLKTHHGDGNDVRAVHAALRDGVAAIRSGEGPRFYEFVTYRWREHCGPNYDNDVGYRAVDEYDAWKLRDPVIALQRALIDEGALGERDVADMQARIDAEIDEAFAFAEASPFPEPSDAFTDVYARSA
jgi:pyruvate dehydrogenase E1 component alpha subunit